MFYVQFLMKKWQIFRVQHAYILHNFSEQNDKFYAHNVYIFCVVFSEVLDEMDKLLNVKHK